MHNRTRREVKLTVLAWVEQSVQLLAFTDKLVLPTSCHVIRMCLDVLLPFLVLQTIPADVWRVTAQLFSQSLRILHTYITQMSKALNGGGVLIGE